MATKVINRRGEPGWVTNEGTFIADSIADPAEGVGAFATVGIQAVNKLASVPERVGALMGSADAQTQLDDREALMAPLAEAHPVASFIGSQPTALIPGRALFQAGIGAVEGALENPQNPIPSALGGAAGAFLGDIVGRRVSQAVSRKLGDMGTARTARAVQRQARQRLQGLGVPLSRTQRNAVGGRSVEAGLQALPFFGQIAEAPLRKQQEILNQAAMKVFGLKTDSAAPGILRLARDNISKKFDLVENSIPNGQLPVAVREVVSDLNILGKGGKVMNIDGVLDGAATLRVRSALNEQVANLAMGGAVPEANLLRASLKELDDFIDEGIKFTRPNGYPAVLDALHDARSEWRFLTALRKGKAVTQGQINPLSMQNALKTIYPGFDIGRELPGKARTFGNMLADLDTLQRGFGTSGTAERNLGVAIVTGSIGAAEPSMLAIPTILAQWAATQPGEAAGAAVGRRTGIEVSNIIDVDAADLDDQ